jgi:hypothetical protein
MPNERSIDEPVAGMKSFRSIPPVVSEAFAQFAAGYVFRKCCSRQRTAARAAIPMRISIRLFLSLTVLACWPAGDLIAQVSLHADGPGNTYELINSVLGGTAEEVPDCSHPEFGRHITEDWDATLGKYVFTFHIHVTPDNDRCSAFDRQRNEIKTYGPSPAYVKGFYGDVCSFRWKFKLDSGFQPSPNFTHIHQIKAGDGTDSGSPIMTITPRSASPERLELIYTAPTGLSGSGKVATANLSGFKGQWIEAYERILYATNGTYEITLRRFSDGALLLGYTNNDINLWRANATFVRPKWGIYRSLNSTNYLRDENVLFADFCIAKGDDVCPSDIHLQPRITAVKMSGSNFVFGGTNGLPVSPYYILTSTNISLPLSNWTRIATNQFDSNGNFSSTNAAGSSVLRQFYLLQSE